MNAESGEAMTLAAGTAARTVRYAVEPLSEADVYVDRGFIWQRTSEGDVADQVDDLAETLLVETRPGVVLREHVLQRRVVALDRDHRVIDQFADGRLLGLGL